MPTLSDKNKISVNSQVIPLNFSSASTRWWTRTRFTFRRTLAILRSCFEVVGVSNSMHPKKVPCHELMNEFDDTPALGLVCCSIWQVTWWNVHTQYEVWLNT